MVILTSDNNNKMSKNIGQITRSTLLRAIVEKRVIVGVTAAINVLTKTPEDSLFCFLAQPKNGANSVTHMNEILLEAFCYENNIYIVKVDNAEKLSRILGSTHTQTCALVQKSWNVDRHIECLTPTEEALVDHCEEYWDFPNQVIELPV